MRKPSEFTTFDAPVAVLGEGPMWSARNQVLYWIDIVEKRIFRLSPATRHVETRELPYAPSAIIPCATGDLLLVTKKGMALMDFEAGRLESIAVPMVDFSKEVFNDAKCDRAGRLWVGTRDLNGAEPNGSLFRVDPDFSMTRHTENLTVSNGLGWSPDERTFYHIDTQQGRMDAYDFDPVAGELSGRRMFIDYTNSRDARPDGCTIDAEGGVWIAELDDWHVRRYTPEGRLEREIRLPFRKPTSVMFGGANLETLFITSMTFRLSETELREQPLAGRLLAIDVGIKGMDEPMFGGGVAGARE